MLLLYINIITFKIPTISPSVVVPFVQAWGCVWSIFRNVSHVLKDNRATMMILSQILSFLFHVSMVKGAKSKTCCCCCCCCCCSCCSCCSCCYCCHCCCCCSVVLWKQKSVKRNVVVAVDTFSWYCCCCCWFLGSGPDKGQSPVEWGEFTYIRTSVRPYVHPSVCTSFHPPWGPMSQPDRP